MYLKEQFVILQALFKNGLKLTKKKLILTAYVWEVDPCSTLPTADENAVTESVVTSVCCCSENAVTESVVTSVCCCSENAVTESDVTTVSSSLSSSSYEE